jgi:DNA end-binding protein Ku
MPGRGIWSGTVSFGLVALPIQLVTAVKKGGISFALLHDKDYARLKRRMYCPLENRIVPPAEIVRGYEIEPDKYVPLSGEELESVSPERSRTVEVLDFIDIGEIDPVFYDRPYYLFPAKGGEKPYRLLHRILKEDKKAGLAKFVLRDREHLVVIQAIGDALGVILLHYPEEILSEADMPPVNVKADQALKKKIRKAVSKMTTDFDPENFTNERKKKILDFLETKIKEQGTVEGFEEEDAEDEASEDLISRIEESLKLK